MTERKTPSDNADKSSSHPATSPTVRVGGVTYLGIASDTDPIYQNGWNFLSGGTLNPAADSKPAQPGAGPNAEKTPRVRNALIPPERNEFPDEESFQEATLSWKHRIGQHLPRRRPSET